MTQAASPSPGLIRYTGRVNPFHRSHRRYLILFWAATAALMFFWLAQLFGMAEDKRRMLAELGPSLALLLWGVLTSVLGPVYVARRVSLTLDEGGIRFNNPVPLLSLVKPPWYLPWSELKRIEYKGHLKRGAKRHRLRQIRLHSRTGRVYTLDPVQWVDSNPDRPDFGLRAKDVFPNLFIGAEIARHKMALSTHLVEDLSARGWPALQPQVEPVDSRPGYTDQGHFDLMQHRGLSVLTFTALALLGYFMVDTYFTSPWRYAESAPLPAFALTGLVLATAAAGLGRGAPRLERLGVTLLFGVAVAAACWPAALRVNAAFADWAPVVATYRSVAPGEFEPVSGDYPPLSFNDFEDYWSHPDQRGDYDFELQRGPLEFWQLNQRRVTGEMRAFFTADNGRTEP